MRYLSLANLDRFSCLFFSFYFYLYSVDWIKDESVCVCRSISDLQLDIPYRRRRRVVARCAEITASTRFNYTSAGFNQPLCKCHQRWRDELCVFAIRKTGRLYSWITHFIYCTSAGRRISAINRHGISSLTPVSILFLEKCFSLSLDCVFEFLGGRGFYWPNRLKWAMIRRPR